MYHQLVKANLFTISEHSFFNVDLKDKYGNTISVVISEKDCSLDLTHIEGALVKLHNVSGGIVDGRNTSYYKLLFFNPSYKGGKYEVVLSEYLGMKDGNTHNWELTLLDEHKNLFTVVSSTTNRYGLTNELNGRTVMFSDYFDSFVMVVNKSHIVIKRADALSSLDKSEFKTFNKLLNKINEASGNKEYYVVNKDEPYAEQVQDIILRNELTKGVVE